MQQKKTRRRAKAQVQDRWGFWGAPKKPVVKKRGGKGKKPIVARRAASDGSWGVLPGGMKVW